MMKKILLGISAIALTVASVPLFAAFEAHVVNVTARIENALFVHPESLEFGTVFPQEKLDSSIFISFSESFSATNQKRVGEVEYVIKQKPKPRPEFEVSSGSVDVARKWCHDNYAEVQPGLALDQQPPEVQLYLKNCYPSLCPYLSKHPDNLPPPGNDIGVEAFHDPNNPANYFYGKLLKFSGGNTINNDPADFITVDLKVPCFKGQCSQDWDKFVHDANPSVTDPSIYQLPPQLEHEIFGCDLWVEVTAINAPPQLVP